MSRNPYLLVELPVASSTTILYSKVWILLGICWWQLAHYCLTGLY